MKKKCLVCALSVLLAAAMLAGCDADTASELTADTLESYADKQNMSYVDLSYTYESSETAGKFDFVDGAYMAIYGEDAQDDDYYLLVLWDMDDASNAQAWFAGQKEALENEENLEGIYILPEWFDNSDESVGEDQSASTESDAAGESDYECTIDGIYYRILCSGDKGIYVCGNENNANQALKDLNVIK